MSNAKTDKDTVSHREQINSAIGTWSGFIYQGLCGMLVALRMIEADKVGTSDYKLQLDGWEDFSILDDKGQIVSLHQCKCIKGRKNYDKDLEKMKQKRDDLTDLKKGAKSYFHCNEAVTIDASLDIEAYPFEEGITKCEPGELKGIIATVVERLKNDGADTEDVVARLEACIDTNVLNTQQMFFDADEKLYVIARRRYIDFADIRAICDGTFVKLTKDEIIAIVKSRYAEQFNERIGMNGGIDKMRHVELFMLRFASLNEKEMCSFMQRIHPKEKFAYTLTSLLTTCSLERINYLFNLVMEFPMDTDKLHWITEKSNQTPSTLSSDQEIELTCRKIYENRAYFDAMWIYDWFVGDIDARVNGESVRNIREMAVDITKVGDEPNEEKSIFREKTVGIMTKKDKHDGKFD